MVVKTPQSKGVKSAEKQEPNTLNISHLHFNQSQTSSTMPTVATAFAETTKRSKTFADLSKRTLRLYRNYLRHADTFVELYELDMPVANIRTKIRQEFERNRYEKDLNISNILYMKGQMEFQELINFWKQNAQVMRYFEHHGDTKFFETKPQNQSEFLDKFLKGN